MLILIGASASGKTVIAKHISNHFGLSKVVTHTTRAIRTNEISDIDYHFVTKEEFLRMKENDEFVETNLYGDNYYGSAKKEIADDKVIVLDPNGYFSYKRLNNKKIITFYLSCSEETRFDRMLFRGDSEENAKKRLEVDRELFKNDLGADFIISTENSSIASLSSKIYKLYIDELKKR